MYVKCYELMQLPTFKNIQFIAGASGLNHPVSWLYVLTTPSLKDWVRGGELVFVVDNADLERVFKDAVLQQVAGLVILKNEENQSVLTKALIDFADQESLPLFEMDYNLKLIDVTREVSDFITQKQTKINYLDYFYHNILFSDHLEQKNIDDFMLHFGFPNDHQFFIAVIHSKDSSLLNDIQDLLEKYVEDDEVRFLIKDLNSNSVILASGPADKVKKAKTLLRTAFSMLNERFPDRLFMTIGNTCGTLQEIRGSYKESMKSMALCSDDKRIIDYAELGFHRLLLNAEEKELKEYAALFLGEVKDYDEANEASFLQTMETYILCNGSISKTAAKLYVHKNTCIYRIARISELFGIDLNDPYTRAEVLNSLAIYRYLGQIQ